MAFCQALILRTLFLLSLVYFCAGATDICAQETDCKSCTSKSSWLFACRWCITSKTCHSHSFLDSNCPCKSDVVSSPFNCPVQPSNRALYTDIAGRNSLFLSAAAYSPTPAACLQRHMPDMQVYSQFDVLCDNRNNSCWAYTAVSHSERRVVISFRGTRGFEQLALEIFNGAEGALGQFVDFAAGGKVVKYFSDAFYALWNSGLQRDIGNLKLHYSNYQLWIVGHSLGGALASMTTAMVTTKGLWDFAGVRLMTFGQPRVGDVAYAQAVEQNSAYYYRVVHKNDLVPHIPPEIPGRLLDSPFHHRFEVWYDNDMGHGSSFTVCLQAEDPHCSDGHIDLSVLNHLFYFGIHIGTFGRANCSGAFDFGTFTSQ